MDEPKEVEIEAVAMKLANLDRRRPLCNDRTRFRCLDNKPCFCTYSIAKVAIIALDKARKGKAE